MIATLDAEVYKVIAHFDEARDRLDTITWVGKRAAECITAEIGTDMIRFPTVAHLRRRIRRRWRRSGTSRSDVA